MPKYTFLFRTKTHDDRDCCAYIQLSDLENKHLCCDGKFNIDGACYCVSLGGQYADYPYSKVDTYLTEEQYNRLLNPNKDDDFTDIIKALTSLEAADFYAEIIASEQEYIMEEYGLDVDDLETIYNEYYLDYRDRAIIGEVYKDAEEVGEVEADGYITRDMEHLMPYFDYKKYGEDIVSNSESYCELSDGRYVYLNY